MCVHLGSVVQLVEEPERINTFKFSVAVVRVYIAMLRAVPLSASGFRGIGITLHNNKPLYYVACCLYC